MTKTTRLALGGVGVFLIIAAVTWQILSSIEPTTYAAINDDLVDVTVWLLWAAAAGQTAFIVTWATLPWHTHWVGRALMVKSVSLAVYLDFALIVHYLRPFPSLVLLGVILFGFITVGIWTQLAAILYEIRRRRRPSSRSE